MGKTQPKATSISDYISQIPDAHQEALQTLRRHIQSQLPEATEVISYGLPTFRYRGKNVIHFGAFKSHIGLYPAGAGSELFEAAGFSVGKGSVRIPFSKPLPFDIIDQTLASNKSRIEAQLKK